MSHRGSLMLALLLLSTRAWGQDINTDNAARMTPAAGSGAGSDFMMTVRRANSSRLNPPEEKGAKYTLNTEIKTRFTMPSSQIKFCQAGVELSYQQRNTEVRIDGRISHDDCPQSGGTLDILISYLNAKGEPETQSFTEDWQSRNGEELEFGQDYVIDEQATLTRVQSRNVRCFCGKSVPAE